MNRKDRLLIGKRAKAVSELLRSIEAKLLGTGQCKPVTKGFLEAIRLHLRSAAREVIENWETTGTSKAAWEMQMACECSLKALSNEKEGSFKESHDLFTLYDQVEHHLRLLRRAELKRLPRWNEMVGLRYGQGESPTLDSCFKMYLATLKIVNESLLPLVTLLVGKIEIGRPPWKVPLSKEEMGRSGGV
jgi:hypothetical protein